MKFYTAKIDQSFFDEHIKENIVNTFVFPGIGSMNCFIIEAIIPAVGDGEVWICGSSHWPAVVYKKLVAKEPNTRRMILWS